MTGLVSRGSWTSRVSMRAEPTLNVGSYTTWAAVSITFQKKCVCSSVIAFLHQGSLTLAGLPLGSRKLFIEEGCTFQGFVELANSILRQPGMYLATDSWLLRRELLLPLLMAEKLCFIFFNCMCHENFQCHSSSLVYIGSWGGAGSPPHPYISLLLGVFALIPSKCSLASGCCF